MTQSTYSEVFHRRAGFIAVFAALGILFALILSIFQPLEYRSKASILVIPRGSVGDGYQVSRSAEKYATTLTSVLPSMSFYNKVVLRDERIAELYTGSDADIRKSWEKTIEGSVKPETGILQLTAYARESADAQRIMATAIDVLEEEGASYLGGNASVLLYMIDSPIVSGFPVRPNYPVNLLGGVFAGALCALLLIVVQTEFGRGREEVSAPREYRSPMIDAPRVPSVRTEALREETEEEQEKEELYAPRPDVSDLMRTPRQDFVVEVAQAHVEPALESVVSAVPVVLEEDSREPKARLTPDREKTEATWMWKQRTSMQTPTAHTQEHVSA